MGETSFELSTRLGRRFVVGERTSAYLCITFVPLSIDCLEQGNIMSFLSIWITPGHLCVNALQFPSIMSCLRQNFLHQTSYAFHFLPYLSLLLAFIAAFPTKDAKKCSEVHKKRSEEHESANRNISALPNFHALNSIFWHRAEEVPSLETGSNVSDRQSDLFIYRISYSLLYSSGSHLWSSSPGR